VDFGICTRSTGTRSCSGSLHVETRTGSWAQSKSAEQTIPPTVSAICCELFRGDAQFLHLCVCACVYFYLCVPVCTCVLVQLHVCVYVLAPLCSVVVRALHPLSSRQCCWPVGLFPDPRAPTWNALLLHQPYLIYHNMGPDFEQPRFNRRSHGYWEGTVLQTNTLQTGTCLSKYWKGGSLQAVGLFPTSSKFIKGGVPWKPLNNKETKWCSEQD
jgi:hypothetical protein